MFERNVRIRKLLAATGIALLATFLVAPAALAFEGREGNTIVIEADEVIEDDYYVGAQEFTLDGTIQGDLFVAAETVRINGTVEGDLFAIGESVIIDGTVMDDARIAGYALIVGGRVEGDVIAFGVSLEYESSATTGGDLGFGGHQVVFEGDVADGVVIGAVAIDFAGAAGGDVVVGVGAVDYEGWEWSWGGYPYPPYPPEAPPVPRVAPGLDVDSEAQIGGNLWYTSPESARIPPGVIEGEVTFERYVPERIEGPSVVIEYPTFDFDWVVVRWFLRQVRNLVTLLLVGALLMWLAPDWTKRITRNVYVKPLPSLGWGVVAVAAFIVLFLALILLTLALAILFGVATLGQVAGDVLALGGIVTAIATFSFGVTWSYVSRIVIGLLFGQLIFRLFKSEAAGSRWWPLVVGVPVYVLLRAVPFLGWIFGLFAAVMGLGAVWIWGLDLWRSRRLALAAEEGAEAEAV